MREIMTASIIKNPLTDVIKNSINSSFDRLNFAVPFISSFSLTILNSQNISNISDKRIVTRFDEVSISSFDLPTLKSLLDLGFKIRFNNNIHLKLYITDNDAYVTSANLTKGGFEDNIELTTKLNSSNIENCNIIFNEIWLASNELTQTLLNDNWSKYELLRKREVYSKKVIKKIRVQELQINNLDIQKIINTVFGLTNDYIKNAPSIAFEANKIRERTKSKLLSYGFAKEIFYNREGHKKRRENLFYEFVYGNEERLAGTGLRELQFQTVFEHKDFKKVIEYIYPEMIEFKPWNFNDKDEFLEFCSGIFEFDIPQYKEAMPIRLASYFYPEYFLPIFKFEHLHKICNAFGLSTDAESKGERLYVYNSFLAEKMKPLPYDNYIKSHISYQIMYIVELHNRLSNGEKYNDILKDYKVWQKGLIESGMNILKKLKMLK
jgi:hypothetical protein